MHNNLLTYRLLPIFSAGLLFTFGCSKKDLEPAQSAGISSVQQATQADATVRLRAKNYIIIASGDQLPSDIEGQTKSANGVMTGLIGATGVATATSDDPNFGVNAAKIADVRSVVHDFTYQGVDLQKERTIEAASDNVNPPSTGDSNPLFPLQWGATAIHAPKAWNTGALGEGVLVADLDTGFELMPPAIYSRILRAVIPLCPVRMPSSLESASATARTRPAPSPRRTMASESSGLHQRRSYCW